MPCSPIKIGEVTAIICRGRGKRQPPCESCGRPSSRQCDYPFVVRDGKKTTCDRHLCNACARPVDALGPNIDFCPAHWNLYEKNGRKLAL